MGIISDLIKKITTVSADNTNKQDKEIQAKIRKGIDRNKKFEATNVTSSRWGSMEKTGSDLSVDPEIEKEHQVDSTAIKSINYDPKTRDLKVTFRGNSKEYLYPKVPKEVVTEWMESPSKGKAYPELIAPYSVNKR